MSREYAKVNPCTMCMPMGSVMVFRGIDGCMPFFHGSQGCSTYMRLYLAHHYREPVDIASSALSEKGAVYGGAANLKQGLRNVIQGYNPKAIGLATTCLSETIGDDPLNIVREFQQEEPAARDVIIIPVSTPSYSGSHEEGYVRALSATVKTLATRVRRNGKVNLILGLIVSPSDVMYLKDLLDRWGFGCILFPDISLAFDGPMIKEISRIPKGGTPLEDIRDMANSKASVTLGGYAQPEGAGGFLEEEFGIPHTPLPLPIGVSFTDLFVSRMEELSSLRLPERYEAERGRLLDAMVDAHKDLAKVKVAIYGDSEMVLGLAKFSTELGMAVRLMATGSKSEAFGKRAGEIAPHSVILSGADFTDIRQEVVSSEIDLMIGPSTGRQLSKEEKIPLLRVGLPIHDRFGASRQQVLGYEGGTRLVDDMVNIFLEHG
jgi:nitrogenase molybdenum-iron protein NifN